MKTKHEKEKAREEFLKKQKKRYKDNLILKKTDEVEYYEFRPTGYKSLDFGVMGIGGLPKGTLTVLFGPESASKTGSALSWIENMIMEDPSLTVLIVDIEHSIEKSYLDMFPALICENVEIFETLLAEDALQTILDAIGVYDIILVDSFAKMLNKDNQDKETSEHKKIGGISTLLTDWCNKISFPLKEHKTIMIGITQPRDDLDSGFMPFAPKKTKFPGGRQLKHTAGLIIEIQPTGNLNKTKTIAGKKKSIRVGKKVKFRAVKNKIGGFEGAHTEMTLMFGKGYCKGESFVQQLLEQGDLTALPGGEYKFKDKGIYTGSFKTGDVEGLIQKIGEDKITDLFKSSIEKMRSNTELNSLSDGDDDD